MVDRPDTVLHSMIWHSVNKRTAFFVGPAMLFVDGIVLVHIEAVCVRPSQPVRNVLVLYQRVELCCSFQGIVRQNMDLISHFFGEQWFDQVHDKFDGTRHIR